MSLKEKEQIILGSSFNLRKIIKNSLDFAFYLVTVVDDRYSNYILYVESEQRIFCTPGIIKYKLEQHLGKKIDDNSFNDLISKINTYASVKLGQKLFYPNYNVPKCQDQFKISFYSTSYATPSNTLLASKHLLLAPL